MKKSNNQKSGFTLIEIIVSMALIGFIAISFLTLFTSGFSSILFMGKKSYAMNYDAQMYMDKIYNNEYSLTTTVQDLTPSNLTDNVTARILDTNYNSSGFKLVEVVIGYSNSKSVKLRGLIP